MNNLFTSFIIQSRIQRYQSSIEFFHSYQKPHFILILQMCQLKAGTEYKTFKKLFQPLFSTHNNVLHGAIAMREHNKALQDKDTYLKE